ncbi:hypothetical protein SPRG_16244 [Saprolegnia parasitica CBS 223.65]|uniref:Apple domain-containing protein n=1 Tax=Saprolegnia parasitica (strain CBS 223.65) TaxID=695850 RepID=A0A067BIR1_SAPPC|nr:hypothetical protein SPRG_16244 [Saprolegnia parasitica CBS 223.65]KDO18279.1 hypothetical protein SPRG_16244 [Saprolegnia parasitica CBS 223.65]|eukprot:XP_012211018.1 hypothetical protein SPRG_16244 [Saprolegnia parasitica CBS 223.65]
MSCHTSSLLLLAFFLAAVWTSVVGAATCTAFEADTDYFGNDIASTSQPTAANCCNDCAATPGCILYVWTNTNGGTCYLKNAQGPASNKPGAQAAVLTRSTCANVKFD